MVKIGHARCGGTANTRVSGDAAGDQTGGEVCIREWYSSPWDYVLRFKDPAKGEKAAQACEAGCANENLGYDQGDRNTALLQAKACNWDLGKIKVQCEVDCSSFMTLCAQCAGVDVPYVYGNAPYTGNMKEQFTSTGEFEVLTDKKYLSSDAYLRRSDILVNSKSHTAMVLENGVYANEKVTVSTRLNGSTVTVELPLLREGDKGAHVMALQLLLKSKGPKYDPGKIDGEFGPKTKAALMAYQRDFGLQVDGVCGEESWTSLHGTEVGI